MGYTHYMYRNKTIHRYNELANDVRRMLHWVQHVRKIPLADGFGAYHTDPVVSSHRIWFNGAGSNAHETFLIAKNKQDDDYKDNGVYFDFCKTNQKPYDLAVMLAILLACEYDPFFRYDTDGTAEDWAEAIALSKEKPWQQQKQTAAGE